MQRIYNKVKNFSGFKANTMDTRTDGLKKKRRKPTTTAANEKNI